MSAREDAGMRAVARVRNVREHDSRVGLQSATAEQRLREAELDRLRRSLGLVPHFDAGSNAAFMAHRASLAALSAAVLVAEQRLEVDRAITAESLVRWQQDKTRVSAVEMLLERRAEERRAEADRVEARALDDIATQAWQRRQDGHGGPR